MSNKYGIIYKATNLVNGKVYIGQTTMPLYKRKSSHIRNKLKTGFAGAIEKYGKDNFIFEEIYTAFDRNELDKSEEFFIEHFRSTEKDFGYNLVKSATNSTKGYKHTPENIRKMTEGRMRTRVYKPHTEEAKLRISQSKKGTVPHNKGVPVTEEMKSRISDTLKEKYKDSNFKTKQCSHLKNPSEATKKKMSESKKGSKASEETKAKISVALKGTCNRWKNRNNKPTLEVKE
jgi:group I intron endonuclease